jgi:hypothetical protein
MNLPPRIAARVAERPPTEGERALAAPSEPLPPGALDEARRSVVRSPSVCKDLRPFISLYGGKWRAAPRYPAPVHATIIEPFAGGAGYSLRYPDRNVILVERDPAIAGVWRYLLRASASEIRSLPDIEPGQDINDLPCCEEGRLLISWWLNSAASGPRRTLSEQGCHGPRSDAVRFACFWGPKVRERIATQVDRIRHWRLVEGDYTSAPAIEATWFIDPPYEQAGKHYRFGSNRIDYNTLGDWCLSRSGQVIVCEQEGATWLSFEPFATIKAANHGGGKHRSCEVIWTQGCIELRPVQLEILAELRRAGGCLGNVGVGRGKELACLLAATAIEAERPMLLCPSGLVDVALEEAGRFGGAFRIRPDLLIVPYELLSSPKRAGLLEELRPDLIVANEAHYLRHKTSARTRRVLRYLAEHDECRFVAVSGTLTAGSLLDYAHLAEAALWERSPIPRGGAELSAWAAVVDADGDPLPRDYSMTQALAEAWANDPIDADVDVRHNPSDAIRDMVRDALRRRLEATPGVVLTKASSCDCSLVIRRVRQPEVPAAVREVMAEVEQSGVTPDGERWLETPDQIATCLRQLALGFSYSWDWAGVDEDVRREWLDARKAWSAALRWVLEQGDPDLDSPARVVAAIETGTHTSTRRRSWIIERYLRWKEIEPDASPTKTTTWHDRWLVEDAARWLDGLGEPGILWYRHQAFGDALRELGVDVRGEGESPPAEPGPVALSVAVHGQGYNLQAWRLGRVVGLPSSAAVWEQLLGRFHRAGQRADVVICDAYAHHPGERRALARAIKRAQAIEAQTGQSQKLLLARVVDAASGLNY